METVFVSYFDDDSDFADRLVLDLGESEVPATYDKWRLSGDDSIIEALQEIVWVISVHFRVPGACRSGS